MCLTDCTIIVQTSLMDDPYQEGKSGIAFAVFTEIVNLSIEFDFNENIHKFDYAAKAKICG